MKSIRSLQYLFFVTSFLLLFGKTQSELYYSYIKFILCNSSEPIRCPANINEVANIVKEAISRNLTVKAFGSKHSHTDIICTEGIPLNTTHLRGMRMNNDSTATFGAGLQVHDAVNFLRKNNCSLPIIPCFGNITIGGAIGTGAHGSSIKYTNSISGQVVSVLIVDGLGNIRTISDPEELKAFKIHLGLLGIVVEVTLKVVPLFKAKADIFALSDDILTNGVAIDMAERAYQISFWWFPEQKTVVVATWTIVDKNTPGTATTNYFAPAMFSNFALVGAVSKEIAFNLVDSTCAAAKRFPMPEWLPMFEGPHGQFENPSVGYNGDMLATTCSETPQGLSGRACTWSHRNNSLLLLDNEFAVDLDYMGNVTNMMKDVFNKTPMVFPLNGCHIRVSGASDILMSTARGRKSAHFEGFSWKRANQYNDAMGFSAGYQTVYQSMALDFDGRPHWGKCGLAYHSADMILRRLDPEARAAFIAVMRKYDPLRIFMNRFGRRLLGTDNKIDNDPNITRCAIMDFCFCTKDGDCASTQICSNIDGYNYTVCKNKAEIAPVTIDTRSLNSSIGLVQYLQTTVPALVTSVIANCSVTNVLETVGSVTPGPAQIDQALYTAELLGKQLRAIRTLADLVAGVTNLVNSILPIGIGNLG